MLEKVCILLLPALPYHIFPSSGPWMTDFAQNIVSRDWRSLGGINLREHLYAILTFTCNFNFNEQLICLSNDYTLCTLYRITRTKFVSIIKSTHRKFNTAETAVLHRL